MYHNSYDLCSQRDVRMCNYQVHRKCDHCEKIVCISHCRLSEMHGPNRQFEPDAPTLCLTCISMEFHYEKPIGKITPEERAAFFTGPGRHLVGYWEKRDTSGTGPTGPK